MPLTTGTRLGPYEITSQLGAGGMGEVYRATDTSLKRSVAIKVLPQLVATDAERLARFQREAEVLASLNHPHIAGIYGLERSSTATALVMELVEGPTLADRIAEGALPAEEALTIARQIAEALETAHEQGIVHRDLKPANIKVRSDGTVKVLDFGLAKALEPPSVTSGRGMASPTITSPAMMTRAGVLLGTAAYMSPEQARGRAVDRRADIWAFGAVLFEMLTGERAFPGEEIADVLAATLTHEPDWTKLPGNLSPGIVAVLRRCLEKDRQKRIRDIGDVRLALDGAFEAVTARSMPALAAARPLWKRAVPPIAAAAVAALITGVALWSRGPSAEPRGVMRFEYVPPDSQSLRNTQRPVIAIAGNGQSFVYLTRAAAFRRGMGELQPKAIPGTEEFVSPILSPDGEWVASFTGGQLKKIAVSGGPPVTICAAKQPFGATWTRDNTIVFGQPTGIMRVSADGGTPELLVRPNDGEQLYGSQLLPGGRAILMSVTRGAAPNRWDQAQIVVQDLGSQRRTVVAQEGHDPRYLPSGHIVYALRDSLFGVRFDVSRMAATSGAVPLVQGVLRPVGVFAAGSNYSVSDEGTLLYAVNGGSSSRSLVWVTRDGTQATPITSIPPGEYEDPRLSPDGKRVLVTRDGDIWVYELESGRSIRLTADGTSLMGVWEPNGSRIAYSSARKGNLEAWVQPVDGAANARQLTSLGGSVHVDSWSPDGRTLLIHLHPGSAPGAPADIIALHVDRQDTAPETLFPGAGSEEGAHLSRDGRHVVYLSNETGQREIYIRPHQLPGEPRTISIGGGQEPLWGRNGDVFYRGLHTDAMFAVSVKTSPALQVGSPVKLFDGRYYVSPTGSPRAQFDVGADGQRFVMLASTRLAASPWESPRIVIVQNWFDEVAAKILPR